MKTFLLSMVAGAAAMTFTPPARGDIEYFNVTWSGAPHSNGASAFATIGIDTASIPNPGAFGPEAQVPPWLSSVSLTVTGSTAGNGTFVLSDFGGALWDTNGGTLNFGIELVGQPTMELPWGTQMPSQSGDFNLFDAVGGVNAPSGVMFFQMRTDGGSGDLMNLVSFAPVPEPSTYALFALGCFGLFALRRARK